MSPDQVDARRRAEMTHAAPANGASAAVSRMADALERVGTVPEDVRYSNPLSLMSYIPGLGRPGSMLPGAAYGIPAAVVNAPGNLKKMFMGAMEETGQRLEGRVQPGTPLSEDMLGLLMSMPGAGMLMAPKGAVGMSGGRLAPAAERLPMDEASRMARADAMFPIEGYHGTPVFGSDRAGGPGLGDLREFDRLAATKYHGRPPGMTSVGNWFAETPDMKAGAGAYAGNEGTIYPVRLALKNPWRPSSYDEFLDKLAAAAVGPKAAKKMEIWQKARTDPTGLRDELRKMGHDGIEFAPGVVDELTGSVRVTLDPNQVRSRFAAFDPAKRDSADLLAAGGVGPVGPMMLQTAPPKSEPLAHPGRGSAMGWY